MFQYAHCNKDMIDLIFAANLDLRKEVLDRWEESGLPVDAKPGAWMVEK